MKSHVDEVEGELRAGVELVLLAGQVDPLVGLADGAQRVLAVLDLDHLGLEHPAQHRDAYVGATEVFDGAIGDRTLGDPGHDVLALDVIGAVPPVLGEDRDLVVGHERLLREGDPVRRVHRVEHEPGRGPVARDPDLHLLDVRAADPHVVREHQGMADRPVVVLFRGTLDHAALDDAPLERVEADLHMLLGERRGCLEPVLLAHELEVAAVQELHVVRVDRVLHDLDEVARQVGPADVAQPMSRTPSITKTSNRGNSGAGHSSVSGPT